MPILLDNRDHKPRRKLTATHIVVGLVILLVAAVAGVVVVFSNPQGQTPAGGSHAPTP